MLCFQSNPLSPKHRIHVHPFHTECICDGHHWLSVPNQVVQNYDSLQSDRLYNSLRILADNVQ